MAIRKKCLYCGEPVRTNDYCSACNLNQEFLKKAYNTSNYYYNIGYDKAKVRDLSGAIESLKMSLRYNKKNVDARNLIGLVYYEMGDVVTALSHWVMSLNCRPKDNIASEYLKKLKNDPKYLENVSQIAKMFNQALAAAGRKDFDLAFIQLKKIVALNQHYIKAYLLMALIYSEQKREGQAKKCLAHILSIDRTNTLAIHYLRELGETEETILKIAVDEIEESASHKEEYYGMEEADYTSTGRPIVKIEPEYKNKRENEKRIKRRKEFDMAKFSNVYMITGLVIGMLVMGFLVLPHIKKNYRQDVTNVEADLSAELSSKNSQIDILSKEKNDIATELDALRAENEELKKTNTAIKNKLSKEALEELNNKDHDDTLDVSNKSNMSVEEIQGIIDSE